MPGLKIRALEAKRLKIPLAKPFSSSLGVYKHVDCLAVLIHTEGGPSGTGYTTVLGGEGGAAMTVYARDEFAPLALGQDALAPEALWHRLWAPNKARLRAGLGVYALSAVDIAAWDIVGKAAGLPLNRLFGGHRQSVPAYGSGGWHTLTDAELLDEAQGSAEKGMSGYKLKIGTPRDRERISMLRREMGDKFTLYADANQKYNVREAVEVSRMLADLGVAWMEEPVIADSLDDLAEVARKSHVPVAAGENAYMRWGFREMCERRAAAYLQPDVGRCGGITELMKVLHLADAYNLPVATHLAHDVSAGPVAASPAGAMVEYMELFPPGTLTREFKLEKGSLRVPDVPGHGVEFTPEAFKRFGAD
ncbi:MAG: mandelate racemase/muconate lactonizing enzyme family protein [Candidatus Tectomicrobia bacterium]|uniref:Mandelate racemase/muconate lactonizing enzyme family protein n=1 Tax=Tectimicrobiota bacterium TaxID=2528274 RepID=A0A932MQ13_UNCTE|nr:mandelate racemase/muconate lactonizing enzyme family protein [Candidatus Tectomicrobia bacterium]